MKKRIIGVLAILALFSFAIAAYAYTSGDSTTTAASCCCKKDGDSCPMKSGGHTAEKGDHAKASCCAKHGADHATADGTQDCCGDSCPMKKGDAATAASTADGKSCCDDCD